MATTIQLLRSDVARQRPDPGVLANGVPMVNLHESEPGLFFSDRTGNLFKIGPVAIGDEVPNTNPEGETGNVKGETWLDTSGSDPILKIYDGTSWVKCFDDPGGTVTSVGLTFDSLFSVSGTPVTTSGNLSATLRDQTRRTVFCAPDISDGTPSFRSLTQGDLPNLSASKITSGVFDAGRLPTFDASKIATGVFSPNRIPDLNGGKITSGVLTYSVGGTGITSIPAAGELLIGTGAAWTKATLTEGDNVEITNGAGTIEVGISSTPSFSSISLEDTVGDTLTLNVPNIPLPYTLTLPASDGSNGALLATNGAGELGFVTSLLGIATITGSSALQISAGGANQDVILAPSGSGSTSVSSRRITNLASPSLGTDATNKAYVDAIAAGIQPKAQVDAATTANVSLSGEQTIDTVPLVAGDRVLVKDQTLPEENGIYDVAVGSWSRSADANTFSELVNAISFVAGGSTNVGKTFLCDSPAGGTIGVDPVNWVLYSSGQGTVTSVDVSLPAIFSVSGGPVTSSGTISATLQNQTSNLVFAGPSGGGPAAPSFRSLVAGDIPFTLGSHSLTSLSMSGSVTVSSGSTYDLGASGATWANIYADNVYAGDVHMSNEGGSNDIDGTWGKYTIQEGEEDLFLVNHRNGKKYRFVLQEI